MKSTVKSLLAIAIAGAEIADLCVFEEFLQIAEWGR